MGAREDYRYAIPYSDVERQMRHYEKYGEWLQIPDLPDRGSGLMKRIGNPNNNNAITNFPTLPVAIGAGIGYIITRGFLGAAIGAGIGWLIGRR